MTFKRVYFENAALCWECTGRGCKLCDQGIGSFYEFMRFRKGDYITNRIFYKECVKELTK